MLALSCIIDFDHFGNYVWSFDEPVYPCLILVEGQYPITGNITEIIIGNVSHLVVPYVPISMFKTFRPLEEYKENVKLTREEREMLLMLPTIPVGTQLLIKTQDAIFKRMAILLETNTI